MVDLSEEDAPHQGRQASSKPLRARVEQKGRGRASSLWWFAIWPLYMEGRERQKSQKSYSRLRGGRFNKEGNLHMRLVLRGCKTSRSPHLPIIILNVYREALTRFSHILSPDGLNDTLPS